MLEYDLRLAETDSPRKRVETLADLADALSDEVKLLAGKDSDRLAKLYGKVVHEGVVIRARGLAPAERLEVLPLLVKRLQRTQEQTGDFLQKLPRGQSEPFQAIALAAHAGQRELRELLEEGSK